MTLEAGPSSKRLCSGFGSNEPVWSTQPPTDGVAAAAHEWLCHRIAKHLRSRGIRTGQLVQEVGDTQSSWRSKLNGTRSFRLEDIIRIALSIDVAVLDVLPTASADLRVLVPPPYRTLLSHHQPDRGMPTFRPVEPDWTGLAARIAEWWTSEEHAGRGWTLSRDVLLQRIVATGDELGLPSRRSVAGAAATDENYCDVEWVTSSVHLRLLWLRPREAATGPTVRNDLRSIGQHLWGVTEASLAEQTTVVVAASAPVLAGVDQILGLSDGAVQEWTALTLTHAKRFGLSTTAETPDVQLRIVQHDLDMPMRWMRVKTHLSTTESSWMK